MDKIKNVVSFPLANICHKMGTWEGALKVQTRRPGPAGEGLFRFNTSGW